MSAPPMYWASRQWGDQRVVSTIDARNVDQLKMLAYDDLRYTISKHVPFTPYIIYDELPFNEFAVTVRAIFYETLPDDILVQVEPPGTLAIETLALETQGENVIYRKKTHELEPMMIGTKPARGVIIGDVLHFSYFLEPYDRPTNR